MAKEPKEINIPETFESMVAELHSHELKQDTKETKKQNLPETEQLYNKDHYIKEFDAIVLWIKGSEIILDKTAFYPEGGGQPGDIGYLAKRKNAWYLQEIFCKGFFNTFLSTISGGMRRRAGLVRVTLDTLILSPELDHKDCFYFEKNMVNLEFHIALKNIWNFISETNKYIQAKKPWEKPKNLNDILYTIAESLRIISYLVYPFIPRASKEIAKQLGVKDVTKKIKPGIKVVRNSNNKGVWYNISHLFPDLFEAKTYYHCTNIGMYVHP